MLIGLLTNTRHGTNSISILNPSVRLYLNTCNKCFIGGLHVGWNIDAQGKSRKCRALTAQSSWGKFRIGNNGPSLLRSVNLRDNNSADVVALLGMCRVE